MLELRVAEAVAAAPGDRETRVLGDHARAEFSDQRLRVREIHLTVTDTWLFWHNALTVLHLSVS